MYCSQVWGQTSSKSIHRIETLQNKALRIINFEPFNASIINQSINISIDQSFLIQFTNII